MWHSVQLDFLACESSQRVQSSAFKIWESFPVVSSQTCRLSIDPLLRLFISNITIDIWKMPDRRNKKRTSWILESCWNSIHFLTFRSVMCYLKWFELGTNVVTQGNNSQGFQNGANGFYKLLLIRSYIYLSIHTGPYCIYLDGTKNRQKYPPNFFTLPSFQFISAPNPSAPTCLYRCTVSIYRTESHHTNIPAPHFKLLLNQRLTLSSMNLQSALLCLWNSVKT